jgi:polysaccharide pyruvyl transferase WcaK-like protein
VDSSCLEAPPITSFADLVAAMSATGSVVAIRYHNVVTALMLGKPTIAIGYSDKHHALLAEAGLEEFSQPVRALDHAQLIRQFKELETRSGEIQKMLAEHKAKQEKLLARQFDELAASVFSRT